LPQNFGVEFAKAQDWSSAGSKIYIYIICARCTLTMKFVAWTLTI